MIPTISDYDKAQLPAHYRDFLEDLDEENAKHGADAPLALVLQSPDETVCSYSLLFDLLTVAKTHFVFVAVVRHSLEFASTIQATANFIKKPSIVVCHAHCSKVGIAYGKGIAIADVRSNWFTACHRNTVIILPICESFALAEAISQQSGFPVLGSKQVVSGVHAYLHYCKEDRRLEYVSFDQQGMQNGRIFSQNKNESLPCLNNQMLIKKISYLKEKSAKGITHFLLYTDSRNFIAEYYPLVSEGRQSYTTSARYYALAAKQGYPLALQCLGTCYLQGYGVAQ